MVVQPTSLTLASRNIEKPAPNPAAFFIMQEGGWAITIAQPLADWLGVEIGDLLGRGWTHFIHPDDHELTRRAVNALQIERPPPPYDQRWIAESGAVIRLRITAWISVSPSGRVRHVTGFARRLEGDYAIVGAAVDRDPQQAIEDMGTGTTHPTLGRVLPGDVPQIAGERADHSVDPAALPA